MTTERHPIPFFLPFEARLLMLGSFPPPRERWSMNFFYPNIQNDMWRVLGLVFYGDKDYFLASRRSFDRKKAQRFCRERNIAMGDAAVEVIRLQANAADKFLQVVRPIDIRGTLEVLPLLEAICVTGLKAMETLLPLLPKGLEAPGVGGSVAFKMGRRTIRLYRMPSTSRAYPKPLEEKAEAYRRMFGELNMLPFVQPFSRPSRLIGKQ